MARIAAEDGIRAIVATPHVDPDRRRPTADVIRAGVAELNEAIQAEGIKLTILPGAEIQLTGSLEADVLSGELLTVADRGKHLLVELPFTGYAAFLPELFFGIQLQGLVPIIAHPERSAVARTDLDIIRGLSDRGCLLQVNADSLLGREGRVVRGIAQTLLREIRVDMIATDAHDPRHRPPKLVRVRRALRRLGGDDVFARLTGSAPARIAGIG